MDSTLYPEGVINKFLNENMLFNDVKLKKYYDRNEQRDLKKFRDRLHSKYSTKTLEKIVYVIVTDSIRDIILDTVGEINEVMKTMGDLIISGGEAYNMYVPFKDRIITTDIDAKFVPRMKKDSKYFGKLQGVKLILWDKLGQIAQKLNFRLKNRIIEVNKRNPKIFKFLGLGFKQTGPYVTRRYTLIKKKKFGTQNVPSKGDIFIDVELFALDLNTRVFSPKTGRIQDLNIGGILDIPFMRPEEFGYDVSFTKQKGITYRHVLTNKLIRNNTIFIAGRDFLIEDIYLMHKLKLRPEKKEKDRQRLIRLSKMVTTTVSAGDAIDTIFKKVKHKIVKKTRQRYVFKNVSMSRAARIDPYKYKQFTTPPQKERLSKQLVHGLKPIVKGMSVKGFSNTSGNQRFNLNTLKWKKNSSHNYVKNEYPLRTNEAMNLSKNLNINRTLYGYKDSRNKWVPKPILRGAAAIPFIGLKK
jgi:hypothetical protein